MFLACLLACSQTSTLVFMVVLLFVCLVPQIQAKSSNPGSCLFRSLDRYSKPPIFRVCSTISWICPAGRIMQYPARELLVSTYLSVKELLRYVNLHYSYSYVIHLVWFPACKHVCKKIALYFFLVTSVVMRLEAWWPETAWPACPGTATTHIRTCAGTSVTKKSREPSRRCYTIETMKNCHLHFFQYSK